MTEKQYYEAIEKYNKVIADRNSSMLNKEEFNIAWEISHEVRRMRDKLELDIISYQQQEVCQSELTKLEQQAMRLYAILYHIEENKEGPITDYEETYVSVPRPSFANTFYKFIKGFAWGSLFVDVLRFFCYSIVSAVTICVITEQGWAGDYGFKQVEVTAIAFWNLFICIYAVFLLFGVFMKMACGKYWRGDNILTD